MTRRRRHSRSNQAIFGIPAIIAIVSCIGLLSALTGDGTRDMLSWAALAVPVITVLWAMARARR